IRYNSPFIEGGLLQENSLCSKIFRKAGDVNELTSYLMHILTLIYRYFRGSDKYNGSKRATIECGLRNGQSPVQGALFEEISGQDLASGDGDGKSAHIQNSSVGKELNDISAAGTEANIGSLQQTSDIEELDVHGEKKALEMEFIYYLSTTVKRLSDILAKLPAQPNPTTWQSLFRKLAAFQSVPFNGEPLKGLQVMGLLETRALDFENLVIIGMNEGVFPKSSPPDSFIPYNLRKA